MTSWMPQVQSTWKAWLTGARRSLLIVCVVSLTFCAVTDALAEPDPNITRLIDETLSHLGENDPASALGAAERTYEALLLLDTPDTEQSAYVRNNLAYALFLTDQDRERARSLWVEAIEALETRQLKLSEAWVLAHRNLAFAEWTWGNQDVASRLIDEMEREAVGAPQEPYVVLNAAIHHFSTQRYDLFRERVASLRASSPDTLTIFGDAEIAELMRTASTALDQGNNPQALDLTYAVIDLMEVSFPQFPELQQSRWMLVLTLEIRREDFEAALTALNRAKSLGEIPQEELVGIESMAQSLSELGQISDIHQSTETQLHQARLTLALLTLVVPDDAPQIGEALRTLARAEIEVQLYEDAADHLQQALALVEADVGQCQLQGLLLQDLSQLRWLQNDSETALALQRRSQAVLAAPNCDALSDTDRLIDMFNEAKVLGELGETTAALALLEDAVERHEAARALRTFRWNDETLLAEMLEQMATLKLDTKEFEEALLLADRAVEIARTYYPEGSPGLGIRLSNAADLKAVLGQLGEAKRLLAQAIEANGKSAADDLPQTLDMRRTLALMELSDPNGDPAISEAQLADVVERRQRPSNRDVLSEARFDFELHAWRQFLRDTPESLDTALDALQWTQRAASAQALEGVGARLGQSEPQLASLLRERQDLLDEDERLSSTLIASLSRVDRDADLIETLRDRRSVIDVSLTQIDEAFRDAGTDVVGLGQIDTLTVRELQSLLGADEVIVTYNLLGLDPDRLAQVEESSTNTVIAITRDEVRWTFVPEKSKRQLIERARLFRCQMAVQDEGCATRAVASIRGFLPTGPLADTAPAADGRSRYAFDTALARGLYRDLLEPVEPTLADKAHLIVVPPSELMALPFHALLYSGETVGQEPQMLTMLADFREAPWLIRRQAVTVLPSLSSLRSLRGALAVNAPDAVDNRLPFLGVGDPIIGQNISVMCDQMQIAQLRAASTSTSVLSGMTGATGQRLADRASLLAMARLPDTVCELQALATTLQADSDTLLLGPDANERRIKSLNEARALEDYRVLAFATHGVIAGQAGATEPGLVLTPPASASEQDDGLLTASEIAAMRLNADMVILSACNTAAGADDEGEGLSGLARAFFHAGARSLLVTHWSVYSNAAVRLTTTTFDVLAADPGLSRSDALRRSMLSVLDDPDATDFELHPSYWAPFALVGEGGEWTRSQIDK